MRADQKYYLIESGDLLELAESLKEKYSTSVDEISKYVLSIGGHSYTSTHDGTLYAVNFKADTAIPEGFCKPCRGHQRPMKKSIFYKEFKKYKKIDIKKELQEKLNIPLCITYKVKGKFSGACRIGDIWNPVGIYWYSAKGQILLVVPDVKKAITRIIEENPGVKIEFDGDVENWDINETGLREIIKEEWDFMVAKHKKELGK